jgi:hypothetical protein
VCHGGPTGLAGAGARDESCDWRGRYGHTIGVSPLTAWLLRWVCGLLRKLACSGESAPGWALVALGLTLDVPLDGRLLGFAGWW